MDAFDVDARTSRQEQLGEELIQDRRQSYPWILALWWRVVYIFFYLGGSIVIIVGSYQYFPQVDNPLLGGWLFTIGSSGFFIVDLMEYWTNSRVGCLFYADYAESFEEQYAKYFEPVESVEGKLQCAANGVNCFVSLVGSVFYLVGSAFFIPVLDLAEPGTYLFIFGSGIITLSQLWRLQRGGCRNPEQPRDYTFTFKNMTRHPLVFWISFLCMLAALAYFIGSFFFLPQFDRSTLVGYEAAWFFTLGSCLDATAAVVLFYRFFFTENFTLDE